MAIFATVENIIEDVITELSQVAGPSVSRYAEDQIMAKINNSFDKFFQKMWWPEYCTWYERTLDGTNGLVSQQLPDIASFNDVRVIYRGQESRPIPLLPATRNPFNLGSGRVQFISGDATAEDYGWFKSWPRDATDDIKIHARVHPGTFTGGTRIYIPRLIMVYSCAWQISEDDATNPGASEKFQVMLEKQWEDYMQNAAAKERSVTGAYAGIIPTQ